MFKDRKDHPYRPVHWRWNRARILNEYGKGAPGRYKDDKWIRIAAEFKAQKDDCKDAIDLYRLFDRYPAIAMAYELWDEENIQVSGKANPMRYELEARILARETFSTIADKSGLPIEVVGWYERLFFNVTDRLNNKMYIFHVVLGDGIQRGMTDKDYALLWKLYGYVRGSNMLDFLITTFSDWSRPTAAQVEDYLLDDHRSTMRRKAAMASRMLGVNNYSSERLIELHTKIVEIEKAASEGAPSEGIQQNIQVMLNHLPLLVGQQGNNQADNKLANFRNAAGDLRADELISLTTQDNVIDVKDVTERRLPEPLTHGKEAK